MYAIDFQNMIGEYADDEDRFISEAHLTSVCKKGKVGACRYICKIVGHPKYTCMKKTKVKAKLDELVRGGKFSAVGDNCEGLGVLK